jgi:adenine-specific DNA-methyltransferase
MNYIGSKIKLTPFIYDSIIKYVDNLDDKVFCDLFAGTGAIGKYFKTKCLTIISNDLEYYSYVLNKNYIENNDRKYISLKYIDYLNNLKIKENGFIFKNYSLEGHGERLYFSDKNAKKIDTIRMEIENLYKSKEISDNEYYFLLASLLEASDKVANTASVYGAYLKKLKKTALQDLILKPAFFDIYGKNHIVFNKDANILIKEIEGDILYLDPPYNQRQYGSNYHLLNTISLYKNDFEPKGKTGLPNYNKSEYCKKNNVLNVFDDLIKNAKFKYIFLSYNNEGLMSEEDVKNIMSKYGEYHLEKIVYKRFKADSNRNNLTDTTFEYLHVLIKN